MKLIVSRVQSLDCFERVLWGASLLIVTLVFALCGGDGWTLAASLVGLTALIFVAKGDVAGQVLTVVFSCLYAVISWRFQYYGEMITYLGMTTPIAVMAVVSWLRHPYAKEKSEVAVAALTGRQAAVLWVLTGLVTAGFFFILRAFHTSNPVVSTVSIATSFLASALMLLRSPAYALAYAANDCVLIVLWVLAALAEVSFLPMVVCFAMFLCNDLYGFVNWRRMQRRQSSNLSSPAET